MLEKLLKKPNELALLLSIAFHQDESTGVVKTSKIKPNKEALSNLIILELVKEENEHLSLMNKKVIDVTLKKSQEEKIAINLKLLKEVKDDEVELSDLDHFKMAKAFHDLFTQNIKSIGGYLVHLEKATFKKWVDPIRLMLTVDKISVEQMREVFKFLDKHPFWSANVQSTEKLRSKFETIYSQIKSNYGTKKESGNGNITKDYIQRIAEDLQSDNLH